MNTAPLKEEDYQEPLIDALLLARQFLNLFDRDTLLEDIYPFTTYQGKYPGQEYLGKTLSLENKGGCLVFTNLNEPTETDPETGAAGDGGGTALKTSKTLCMDTTDLFLSLNDYTALRSQDEGTMGVARCHYLEIFYTKLTKRLEAFDAKKSHIDTGSDTTEVEDPETKGILAASRALGATKDSAIPGALLLASCQLLNYISFTQGFLRGAENTAPEIAESILNLLRFSFQDIVSLLQKTLLRYDELCETACLIQIDPEKQETLHRLNSAIPSIIHSLNTWFEKNSFPQIKKAPPFSEAAPTRQSEGRPESPKTSTPLTTTSSLRRSTAFYGSPQTSSSSTESAIPTIDPRETYLKLYLKILIKLRITSASIFSTPLCSLLRAEALSIEQILRERRFEAERNFYDLLENQLFTFKNNFTMIAGSAPQFADSLAELNRYLSTLGLEPSSTPSLSKEILSQDMSNLADEIGKICETLGLPSYELDDREAEVLQRFNENREETKARRGRRGSLMFGPTDVREIEGRKEGRKSPKPED